MSFFHAVKEDYSHEIKMLMQLHYSRLGERDRRHYAALESLKLGRGGITYICKVLGVDRGTVIRGRKELMEDADSSQVAPGRQRKGGGGRKKNDSRSRN
ncbi:MAG: hypothetical protein H6581_10850 [Bacteroidia bacterium]|nr:hypothetical protein [Bacteroidia bacterium]MCB9231801.1 hypothetical protein [Bacteroidia bacterium]MCB9232091.1 hypothetical protein [Bacteroidia bacterium]MCB9232098.1 hypothetical protein [Bacteroidia bacterium]MCB9232154.1 hypothetical protein [Bacteroidia bacterium]